MQPSRRLALTALALTLAVAAPARAGDGTSLTKLLPDDTQIMMVFDAADARDSALLQSGVRRLPFLVAKLAELGIDPLTDVDTVVVAAGGITDLEGADTPRSVVLIVEGRLARDPLTRAPGATSSTHLGVTVWTTDGADAAFIGDRLFVSQPGTLKPLIAVALGKGRGRGRNLAVAKRAQPMRAALARTDTSADVWLTVLLPTKNRQALAKAGLGVASVAVGANLSAALAIRARMDARTPAAATTAATVLRGFLGDLAPIFTQLGLAQAAATITVATDRARVTADLTITSAELDALIENTTKKKKTESHSAP